MRKRKSPIVLLTTLVVVVTGIVGFQLASGRTGGNPADQPPTPEVQDTKPIGETRPATSTSAVAQNVKVAMGSGGAPASPEKRPDGPPGMPGGGGPLILNPSASAQPEKPKPNPSSTSAQWYDKESALGSGKG